MRIDFGASYKEVSRILRASSSPSTAGTNEAFQASLNGASLDAEQVGENADKKSPSIAHPQAEYDDQVDMRASFRFNDPGLEMPSLRPIPLTIQEETVPSVAPTPQQSVKTPTVLEVKRVEMGNVSQPANAVAVDKEGIRAMLKDAGQKFGIDSNLAMSVVKAESDYDPKAVSSDGHASKGLFQLLDSTGKGLLARGDNPERIYKPFDASLNIELGTSYLKYLHDIFSTPTALPNDHSTKAAANSESLEKLAVAAFNAGEGRVASAQRRAERAGKDPAIYDQVEAFLPKSTQAYVTKVVSGKSQS